MKLFHITFHKGCANDTLELFSQMDGVQVDTCFIHADAPRKTDDGWYKLGDPNVVNELLELVRDRALAADVILTSDTAPLALLFGGSEFAHKHIVVYVCNRLNYKLEGNTSYRSFVNEFSRRPNVTYVSYTPFEEVFAQRAGFDVKWSRFCIRPIGTKPRTEKPVTNRIFIGDYHNDTKATNLQAEVANRLQSELILHDKNRFDGVDELQTFAAVVHIPYAASNLALFEGIAAGTPYLIPSKQFMQHLMRTNRNLFVPDRDVAAIEWYNAEWRSLFYTFDSFDDLTQKLQFNFSALRSTRLTFHKQHVEKTLLLWKNVLNPNSETLFNYYSFQLQHSFDKYFSPLNFIKVFGQTFGNRDVTYKYLLRALPEPTEIVELGCARSFMDGSYCNEVQIWTPTRADLWDWSAGCFLKVFSDILGKATFTTVDMVASHVSISQMINANKRNITFVTSTSEAYLESQPAQKFDLIYIDTGDVFPPDVDLALREVECIVRRDLVKPGGYVLIDDVHSVVPANHGHQNLRGKAQKSLPFLLEHGFQIILDEYQTLLQKVA